MFIKFWGFVDMNFNGIDIVDGLNIDFLSCFVVVFEFDGLICEIGVFCIVDVCGNFFEICIEFWVIVWVEICKYYLMLFFGFGISVFYLCGKDMIFGVNFWKWF